MSEFSKVLRSLRNDDGLTQVELGKKLGLSGSAISMYERGEREPELEILETIADYFNVSIDYLNTGNIVSNSPSSLFSNSGENIIQTAKIALFGGADHVTDEMWQEVVNFAKYIEAREADKNRNV